MSVMGHGMLVMVLLQLCLQVPEGPKDAFKGYL